MARPLIIIYVAVALDAMGIGLIFPILPALLKDLTHSGSVAPYIGGLTALYAGLQFLFAPVLGALSDQYGRRPVFLASLAGAALDYFILAVAPGFWLLVIGRAIAGLTSANMSVAGAYITDISPEEHRARRFGLFNAMFGAGFIVGPVLGGVLGDHWIRLPFVAASLLNACNLLLAWFLLPETRTPTGERFNVAAFNPLHPLRWALKSRSIVPIFLIYFTLSAAGEAYSVCWALWGHDTFAWNAFWIGLSLGTFGVFQTLVQAFLPGVAAARLGERRAVLLGIACSCGALAAMAFADRGWMVFAIMPFFALGSLGTPALQALATRQVASHDQGRLQGVLSGAISLASIAAPIAFSTIYLLVESHWPGAVWLSVAAVNLFAVPLVLVGTRQPQADPPSAKPDIPLSQ